MVVGKLRREGDDLVVEIRPMEPHSALRPELRAWLDENWSRLEPGLRYLADK